MCVCVCPPLKLKPYFSPLDALLDGSAAPAGNLAAEILPAELRWVPGGVLEPQCCPTCPDPPPLFHPPPRETVARLQQENQRLQAQEAALRVQRDRLQQQLRDIDRYGGDGGGVPITPLPRSPFPPL